jgi:hypothetical protein
MRTTLDIDEDVLQAVKAIAVSKKSTAGKILSEMGRAFLQPPRHRPIKYRTRNGVPLFPRRPGGEPVTSEFIKRLREETDV